MRLTLWTVFNTLRLVRVPLLDKVLGLPGKQPENIWESGFQGIPLMFSLFLSIWTFPPLIS